jgi:hypothetical protein
MGSDGAPQGIEHRGGECGPSSLRGRYRGRLR